MVRNLTQAVVRGGYGRGFVVEHHHNRVVITASQHYAPSVRDDVHDGRRVAGKERDGVRTTGRPAADNDVAPSALLVWNEPQRVRGIFSGLEATCARSLPRFPAADELHNANIPRPTSVVNSEGILPVLENVLRRTDHLEWERTRSDVDWFTHSSFKVPAAASPPRGRAWPRIRAPRAGLIFCRREGGKRKAPAPSV